MFDTYIFTPSVASSFGGAVNQLPQLRAQIGAAYSALFKGYDEAAIVGVMMMSASPFTVKTSYAQSADATPLPSGKYLYEQNGGISELIFAADTTLTAFEIKWFVDKKNHDTLTLTVTPSGATVTVTDDWGFTITPSVDGTYEVLDGWYTTTTSAENYVTTKQRFMVIGDMTFAATAPIVTYPITTTAKNVTGASANAAVIAYGTTITLTYTANTGYNLPASVSVSGATSSWDRGTGVLTLSNPTGAVTIDIAGVLISYTITATLTNIAADSANPASINYGGTATMRYTADSGYTLPATVTVSGATGVWTAATGTLELSAPTGNVTYTIGGVS